MGLLDLEFHRDSEERRVSIRGCGVKPLGRERQWGCAGSLHKREADRDGGSSTRSHDSEVCETNLTLAQRCAHFRLGTEGQFTNSQENFPFLTYHLVLLPYQDKV